MKSSFYLIALLSSSILLLSKGYSQKPESVLNTPDDWLEEIIEFPIGFAPTITLKGFEDLRFAPGWRDSTAENYFSYMFVWFVEKDSALTSETLSIYFNSYYDGLMGVHHHNKTDTLMTNQLNETISVFIESENHWIGKVRLYERFVKNDYIVLNIVVTQTFCAESNQQIIRCEISPQGLDHKVWREFERITIKPNVCR